jgi:hypothetical protein
MMTKYKSWWAILGFALVVLGFTSIWLQMVGSQWAFLAFLEKGGRLVAFVVKLLMVMAGFVLFILAMTDWERERRRLQ